MKCTAKAFAAPIRKSSTPQKQKDASMIICAGGLAHRKAIPTGFIHFAPAVSMEQFDRGFDALQMFARLEGVNGDTIVRGFCTLPEQRMGDLLHSSL